MDRHILKKGLITGIVFLFLSTSCFPFVTASNEKPDLIIEDIFLDAKMLFMDYFCCTVRNIGNSPTHGYVEVYVKVYWLLFRCIPLIPIKSYITRGSIKLSIIGEETTSFSFLDGGDLPPFGYYRIFLTINPNRLIDESNFDNNMYYEDCHKFFGYESMIDD